MWAAQLADSVRTETKGECMQTIAFAAPMLPGKTDTDREAMASCAGGERKADPEASRRRAGIGRGEPDLDADR